MSDIEIASEEILPECPTMRDTPPPCSTMATEEDDHYSNNQVEQQKSVGNPGHPRKRPKSKGKLVRSLAVCDESLTPQENSKGSEGQPLLPCNQSDQPACGEDEQRQTKECEAIKKPCLSKEPSLEYTDSTGIDLEEFIINTLKSSPRDRLMLLKLEQDMIDFITDNSTIKKFPQMSSYHRMLVHRVAAYFGMEHNVDPSGKAVIINKTSNTRIPEQRFADHVQEERSEERRSILKRDSSQEKEESQLRLQCVREEKRSKSIEEREEEYQRARERIFSQDNICPHENIYIETRGVEDSNVFSETQKKRQLFRGNRDGSGRLSGSRQSSFELDSRWGDPRPWSSTDSDSSTRATKLSHSFSDSSTKLSKIGSESSSGGSLCGSLPSVPPTNNPTFILLPAESSIPPGSILVNPHTGQPFLNPDGTPAIYNPPTSQQPMSTAQQQAPPPPLPQHPMASHSVPQTQYSSVSYLPPQQMLAIPSPQHYSGREELSAQFGHMSLSRQSSGDAPDPPSLYHTGGPPTQTFAPPQQCYAPPMSADSYITSGLPMVPPTAPPPQSCSQHSTQAQVYCSSGQCPSSYQQYGLANYNTQTGYPTLLANQQQAYSSMMGTQPPPNSQQCMMGTYPTLSSYPVPQQQQQSYQTAMLMGGQGGQTQGAVPVYCSALPSSAQDTQGMLGVTCPSSSYRNTCSSSQSQGWY